MESLEIKISKLIIGVVILATIVTCIGGVLYLYQHGNQIISYRLFQGEPTAYTSFFGIWKDAFTLSARGIMQLGILLLVAGQAIRVLLTMFLFTKQKDHFFTFASLIIFIIMLISLFGYTL